MPMVFDTGLRDFIELSAPSDCTRDQNLPIEVPWFTSSSQHQIVRAIQMKNFLHTRKLLVLKLPFRL